MPYLRVGEGLVDAIDQHVAIGGARLRAGEPQIGSKIRSLDSLAEPVVVSVSRYPNFRNELAEAGDRLDGAVVKMDGPVCGNEPKTISDRLVSAGARGSVS